MPELTPNEILLTVDQTADFEARFAASGLEEESREASLLEYKKAILFQRTQEAAQERINTNIELFLHLAGHNQSNLEDYKTFFKSELTEMQTAFEQADLNGVLDGYGDCAFVAHAYVTLSDLEGKAQSDMTPEDMERISVVQSMMNLAGGAIQHMIVPRDLQSFDPNLDMSLVELLDIVAISNMTKFDTTLEDAQATQASYAAKGIKTAIYDMTIDATEQQYFANRVVETVEVGGEVYPANKLMKSVKNFTKPDFSVQEERFQLTF